MDIKFHIEKLGAITDSVIELKPLMLFSGESGTGKSYTAFLIYYFYELILLDERGNFGSYFLNNFKNKYSKQDFLSSSSKEFELDFKIYEDFFNLNISSYIAYLTGNESFECNVRLKINQTITFKVEKDNQDNFSLYCETTKVRTDVFEGKFNEGDFYDFFGENIIPLLFGNIQDIFLLPPSRGGYLGFPPSVYEKIPAGMYKEFISQLDELISPSKDKLAINPLIEKSLQEIFEGKIEVDNGRLSYSFQGEKIPITAAASSIKELTPLFLLLRKHQPKDCMILWEEPETHLHPSLQRKVAKLVSFLLHHEAYLTITTHSDYFFNQINNLIKLYHIQQKTDEKTFAKLLKTLKIDEQLIINPEQVGAYYFEKQGKTVKIKKQELDTAIPIDSFKKLVDEMLNETDAINDILYE